MLTECVRWLIQSFSGVGHRVLGKKPQLRGHGCPGVNGRVDHTSTLPDAIMRAPVRLAFANLRPVKLVASDLNHHYLET
jgi:hypothetical protein